MHNGSTDLFGVLLDLGAIRDQIRQAEIDTAQLVRVLASRPDLSGLALGAAAPAIDPSRIAYVGNSLGAIEGSVAAALEPHVEAWTLNVGGGGIIQELAAHSPIVSGLLKEALGLNFAFVQDTFDEAHPAIALAQTVVEPADPLVFAADLALRPQPLAGQPTTARNVLQIEVINDEWVPNESNEALARAGGWGVARPDVGSNAEVIDYKNLANDPGRVPLVEVAPSADGTIHDTPAAGLTAVLVQSSPATHGDNLTSSQGQREYCIPYANFASSTPFDLLDSSQFFSVPEPYRATQAAVIRFVTDAFAGKVPSVTVPVPPVRDLDADGATDDVDSQPCNPHVK